MESNQSTDVIERIFPTEPNEAGYYYETEEDETMGIETKVYENGNKVKRSLLPACNKVAVVRELIANDHKYVVRYQESGEKVDITANTLKASITVATTLDDEKQPIENIGRLKMKDYNMLIVMYQQLNF